MIVPSAEKELEETILSSVIKKSEGLSGRALRKLPFMACSQLLSKQGRGQWSVCEFLQALEMVVEVCFE